ncbi:MAG: hypothetical protein J0L82_09915 [Deltaproteobacteria bacterium]|jgi:hypothetical protein|nr:hypothetical protein [Deltaproteobacteria bacterium]
MTIAVLPLVVLIIRFLPEIIPNQTLAARRTTGVALSLLSFVLVSMNAMAALAFIFVSISLFYFARRRAQGQLPVGVAVSVGILLAYIPLILYAWKAQLTGPQLTVLILFKTCFAMRFLSWIVDHRVYLRFQEHGLIEFLEYLFCPIFFLLPGQIQYVQYSYFHKSKAQGRSLIPAESLRILGMGLWGIFLMGIFSLANEYFWRNLFFLPGGKTGVDLAAVHLALGLYWLVIIYFQQTAGMAFQISLGRFLGYELKYDMHLPLLARSPLDYLRRHSSYVRDFVVDVGVRPLGLWLVRSGYSTTMSYFIAAIASYAVLVGVQVGYRADLERPPVTGLAMIGFLIVFLLIPGQGRLGEHQHEKSIGRWTVLDYVRWISTIIILGIYKSVLGLVR